MAELREEESRRDDLTTGNIPGGNQTADSEKAKDGEKDLGVEKGKEDAKVREDEKDIDGEKYKDGKIVGDVYSPINDSDIGPSSSTGKRKFEADEESSTQPTNKEFKQNTADILPDTEFVEYGWSTED